MTVFSRVARDIAGDVAQSYHNYRKAKPIGSALNFTVIPFLAAASWFTPAAVVGLGFYGCAKTIQWAVTEKGRTPYERLMAGVFSAVLPMLAYAHVFNNSDGKHVNDTLAFNNAKDAAAKQITTCGGSAEQTIKYTPYTSFWSYDTEDREVTAHVQASDCKDVNDKRYFTLTITGGEHGPENPLIETYFMRRTWEPTPPAYNWATEWKGPILR